MGKNKWDLFQMPASARGKSFLDVGCWEGANCVEAVRRGASPVVGVDLCTSQELRENVEEHDFQFLQLDVFSEKFLALDTYDIVLCSGVLYHVENPISLLFRLRKVCREQLVIETLSHKVLPEHSMMLFYPSVDEGDDPTTWWVPNQKCLTDMLETSGFTDVRVVQQRDTRWGLERVCMTCRPGAPIDANRIHPRRPQLMSLWGGDRSKGVGPPIPKTDFSEVAEEARERYGADGAGEAR